MRREYLTFGSPHIGEEEIAEVMETLRSGWIGTGPKVAAFEAAFADYVGVEHAIAVSSCTAALHLSMAVLGLGPGDEVITTPMTFCATAAAIVHAGATPVFADIDRETMNIDPARIEAAITPRTKAVLPVHFAGRPCQMDAILAIARRHGLAVIEDAAHAIETMTSAGKVGTVGDMTCFSFYATKNVVTAEGGMITTDRSEWADRLKTYALHGLNYDAWKRHSDEDYKHYQVVVPGFKYNMTDIQASLGIHQLRRVEDNLRCRDEIWARYDQAFAEGPLETPRPSVAGEVHARHLYTVLVDPGKVGMDRDELQRRLHEQKIGTGIHYVAVHLQPYYAQTWGFRRGDFPTAECVSDRTLSLPISVNMSDSDVEDVVAAVDRIIAGHRSQEQGAELEKFTTVVSGLPRSGTSMLMKMLDAGGVPPLTDGIRTADDDNPGGYYELEKVKQLDEAADWIDHASGRAVKVISQLLYKLPGGRRYKIVFALRDMNEILASQRQMLIRRGQQSTIDDEEMALLFGRHLQEVRRWLEDQSHMEVLFLEYGDVLRDPRAAAAAVRDFLGLALDLDRMAGIVDENLYRQRNG
mgnify:CR=1 FL=1